MDNVIAKLVVNSNAMGNDELCLLMYLMSNALVSEEQRERDERFNGRIFSTINYNELCGRYNLLDATVDRILKKFEGLGWLKFHSDGVTLGEWQEVAGAKKKFWYCSQFLGSCKNRSEVKETALQQLRRLVAENKKHYVPNKLNKLSQQAKSEILSTLAGKKQTTPSMRVLCIVKTRYVQMFNKAYNMQVDNVSGKPSFPKELKFWNNALQFLENDEARLVEVVNWTFDNWEKVKQATGWLGIGPGVTLFATRAFLTKLIKLKDDEYIEQLNVGNRFSEAAAKNAPASGYGE